MLKRLLSSAGRFIVFVVPAAMGSPGQFDINDGVNTAIKTRPRIIETCLNDYNHIVNIDYLNMIFL